MANDNMKVVTVMSRKGGAGKTTLVRALASAAMRDGKRCIIFDTDPQQGMLNWANAVGINDPLLKVEHLEFSDELGTKTDEAYDAGDTDYIFVDSMGAAGAWADDLAAASDVIILPMKLSMDDWKSTNDTYDWYKGLAERAEDPEAPYRVSMLSYLTCQQNKAKRNSNLKTTRSRPSRSFLTFSCHANSTAKPRKKGCFTRLPKPNEMASTRSAASMPSISMKLLMKPPRLSLIHI